VIRNSVSTPTQVADFDGKTVGANQFDHGEPPLYERHISKLRNLASTARGEHSHQQVASEFLNLSRRTLGGAHSMYLGIQERFRKELVTNTAFN